MSDEIATWLARRKEGQRCRAYAFSPNGGDNDCFWATAETLEDILGLDDEEGQFTLEGDKLSYSRTPPRGVHQHYELTWEACPDGGRRRVAYLGVQIGFEWEDCESSEALETLLEDIRFDKDGLGELGLTCCEDFEYGDDGGFWLVEDEKIFQDVFSRLREIDEEYEELDIEEIRDLLRGRHDGGNKA